MNEPETLAPSRRPRTLGVRLVLVVTAFFAVAPGAALIVGGVEAINDRHYELRRRAVNGFGPAAFAKRGVAVFDGAEGVRWGVGFVAAGATLAVWGVGILGTAVRRGPQSDEPVPIMILLGRSRARNRQNKPSRTRFTPRSAVGLAAVTHGWMGTDEFVGTVGSHGHASVATLTIVIVSNKQRPGLRIPGRGRLPRRWLSGNISPVYACHAGGKSRGRNAGTGVEFRRTTRPAPPSEAAEAEGGPSRTFPPLRRRGPAR